MIYNQKELETNRTIELQKCQLYSEKSKLSSDRFQFPCPLILSDLFVLFNGGMSRDHASKLTCISKDLVILVCKSRVISLYSLYCLTAKGAWFPVNIGSKISDL